MPLSKNDIRQRMQNAEDWMEVYANRSADPNTVGEDIQRNLDLWTTHEKRYYRLYDEVEYGIKSGGDSHE
jgi:hypothetical protein